MLKSPRRTTLVTAALAVAASLALVLSGCAPGSDSGGDARLVNIYTGSTGNFTANFNPFISSANQQVLGTVYEPLFYFNAVKASDPAPWLGSAFTMSDDGKTFEITTRDGVKWQDGKDFTAADVAYTYGLLKEKPALNLQGLKIESVKATDATHVTLTMSTSYSVSQQSLLGNVYIVPEHIWKSVKNPGKDTNAKPVGTGAFAFGKFTPQSFTLTKNSSYYEKGKPAVAGLRIVSSSGNTAALNSLNAGQLDWAGIAIQDIKKSFVDKNPKYNKFTVVPGSPKDIEMNLAKAPYTDVNFRKALSLSIDRDLLNKQALGQYNAPVNPTGFMTPRDEKYIPAAYKGKTIEESLPKAKELLASSGYTLDGSGHLLMPDGKPVTIELKTVTGYTDIVAASQLLIEEWGKLGIPVTLTQQSQGAFTSDRLAGNFDVIPWGLDGGPTPFVTFDDALNSSYTAPIGENAGTNAVRFSDPQVDQWLETIRNTQDEKVQLEAYGKLGTYMAEQVPYILTAQNAGITMYRNQHFTNFPTTDNLYADPSNWQPPNIGVVGKELKPVK